MKDWLKLLCIATFCIYLYFMYYSLQDTLTHVIAFTAGWMTTGLILRKGNKHENTAEN